MRVDLCVLIATMLVHGALCASGLSYSSLCSVDASRRSADCFLGVVRPFFTFPVVMKTL